MMGDTLLMLFSYQPSEGVCALDELPHLNWRRFAARMFADSIESQGTRAPLLVSAALAMRAGNLGWDDDFRRWGLKAHELGKVDKELLEAPDFKTVSAKLLKEERLFASSRRFRIEFDGCFGYPVLNSPLLREAGL